MKYLYILIFFFSCSYISLRAQCIDNGHSPFDDQGWLSCDTSIGPVPERGDVHWIMYDLGEEYVIDSMYYWNHNVWGETGMGVKQILIDYSTDKIDWTTIGPYTIDRAPGSWKYTGVLGPSFPSIEAQYLLVSVVSTWDETVTCAGIGEIKFILGEPTVETQDISDDIDWSISPNPSKELITIELPTDTHIYDLSIYNAVGQAISTPLIPTNHQLSVPISHLEEGLYYVSYQSDKGTSTRSFVKVE